MHGRFLLIRDIPRRESIADILTNTLYAAKMGNQENMFTRSDTGDRYLAYRPSYPQELYDHILSYHDSSPGAARELCVDLGCGPGIVTRAIAPAFNKTIGVDPSESMIDTAKRVEGQQGIEYMVGSAEDLKGIEDASVDLAIGGTMAHWLQPESWYTEMARVLRPGGTIAVFAYAWSVLLVGLFALLLILLVGLILRTTRRIMPRSAR